MTIKGIPNDGWGFVRWEGDWTGENNSVNLSMKRDYNIVGVFESRDYPLNIVIIGE